MQSLVQDKYNIGVLMVNIEFIWLDTKRMERLAKARLSLVSKPRRIILYLPSILQYFIYTYIYLPYFQNKDGLVYADLELSPGPSGKQFVIRGLENRNNYTIIDLTKTAEPLLSESESKTEKEKT